MESGKLGGVCAGIANYFDKDVTLIRLLMFVPLILSVMSGPFGFFGWFEPMMHNIFIIELICYLVMWFTVPVASSARQKLEMRGEKITAQSIKENTIAAADIKERSIIAKIVGALGTAVLIALKFFALLLLIALVVGGCFAGMMALCGIPRLGFDFHTGFTLRSLFFVALIPTLTLIYLIVTFLISRRPRGVVLLVMLILWIISWIVATIGGTNMLFNFDKTENSFITLFDNLDKQTDKVLNLDTGDLEEYAESIGVDMKVGMSSTQYKIDDKLISICSKPQMKVILYGDQISANAAHKSLKMDDEKKSITFRTEHGTPVKVTLTKVDCPAEKFGTLSTDVSGKNATHTFKVDKDLYVQCIIGERADKDRTIDKKYIEKAFMIKIAGQVENLHKVNIKKDIDPAQKAAEKIEKQAENIAEQAERATEQAEKMIEGQAEQIEKQAEQLDEQFEKLGERLEEKFKGAKRVAKVRIGPFSFEKTLDGDSEEEIIEKAKSAAESKKEYGTEGVKQMTHYYTIGKERAVSYYENDMHIMLCGKEKDVQKCEESISVADNHLSFVTPNGKKVKASNEGVKVNGKEYTGAMSKTTSMNNNIATTTYNFSIDGIKVQFQQGPDIDTSEVTEELVRNIFGTTSKIFDAAGNIISAAGNIISTASKAIGFQKNVEISYQRSKNTAIYKDILEQAKLSEPNKGATTATKTGTEAWATNPKVYHYPVKGNVVKGYSHDGVYILFYGSEKDVDCCIRHFAIDQNGYVQTTTRMGNKFLITKYGIKSLFESSKNKVVEIERYAEVRGENEFGEQNLLMGKFDDVEYRYLIGPSNSPAMKENIAKISETSYIQEQFPQKNS
jgi:phage shock protein PspC (stress-responsive transcriptional regulator)